MKILIRAQRSKSLVAILRLLDGREMELIKPPALTPSSDPLSHANSWKIL